MVRREGQLLGEKRRSSSLVSCEGWTVLRIQVKELEFTVIPYTLMTSQAERVVFGRD